MTIDDYWLLCHWCPIIRSVPCSAVMLGHHFWEALINNPCTLQRGNFLYTCIYVLPLIYNHFYSHIIHTDVAVYWNVKESMYVCLIIWSWVLYIYVMWTGVLWCPNLLDRRNLHINCDIAHMVIKHRFCLRWWTINKFNGQLLRLPSLLHAMAHLLHVR